jgi:hypothetical protein
MDAASARLNITLDAESAAKLARLAERIHVQEGTWLARCSRLRSTTQIPTPAA